MFKENIFSPRFGKGYDFLPVVTQGLYMQFVSGNILSACALCLAFSTVTLALRHRDTYLARRLTIPDRRIYDSLWAAIVADRRRRDRLRRPRRRPT